VNIQELEEKADRALNYLAATDKECAAAKAKLSRMQEMRKTIHALGFGSSGEKAVEAKRLDAYTTLEYTKHLKDIEEAEIDYHTLYNRRQTAQAISDMYRTVSANQRRG